MIDLVERLLDVMMILDRILAWSVAVRTQTGKAAPLSRHSVRHSQGTAVTKELIYYIVYKFIGHSVPSQRPVTYS